MKQCFQSWQIEASNVRVWRRMLQEGSCALLTGNSNIERIRHSRQILIEKYMPVVFLLPIMWTSHKAYLLLLLTYISYSAMLFSRMISRLLLLSLLTGFFHSFRFDILLVCFTTFSQCVLLMKSHLTTRICICTHKHARKFMHAKQHLHWNIFFFFDKPDDVLAATAESQREPSDDEGKPNPLIGDAVDKVKTTPLHREYPILSVQLKWFSWKISIRRKSHFVFHFFFRVFS